MCGDVERVSRLVRCDRTYMDNDLRAGTGRSCLPSGRQRAAV
eukprot:COSAG02_NODE_978_length_15497_cov_11.288349_6_plen_42_part_00